LFRDSSKAYGESDDPGSTVRIITPRAKSGESISVQSECYLTDFDKLLVDCW